MFTTPESEENERKVQSMSRQAAVGLRPMRLGARSDADLHPEPGYSAGEMMILYVPERRSSGEPSADNVCNSEGGTEL